MASGNKTTINRSRSKVRLINFNDHINEGYVFLAYGQRLSDLLNDDRDFLPLETEDGEVRVVSKRSIMEVEVLDATAPGKSAEPSSDVVQLISGSAFDILGVPQDADDSEIRLRYLALKESISVGLIEKVSDNKDLAHAAGQLRNRYDAAYDSITNTRKIEAIGLAMRDALPKRRRFGD
ncbi:MAG: hypothetical protein AAB227_12385 [Pseudomonadota bacterium]